MARVELDPNFARKLLGSEQLRSAVKAKTEAVARRARELAPDDPDTGRPDIRTGITADVDVEDGVLTGRVNARDWKSHLYEFGHRTPGGGTREKPFLRPAADAEGLRTEGNRR